jgi:SAM-dependent methyltransferase
MISFRDGLREAYDRDAQRRDESKMEAWKVVERDQFLKRLLGECKRSLLEIGSGPGRDAKFFKDQGLDVVCIDLSPEMVKRCQAKGLTAYVMDVGDLQFPTNRFDAIYALNSFLHLAKTEMPAVLRRIAVLLKPNGLFFLGLYGGEDFEGIWEKEWCTPRRFFSFYGDDDLRQIVGATFEILSFDTISLGNDANLHFQSLTVRRKDKA